MTVCHLTSVHTAFDTRIFAKECRSLAKAGYTVHMVVGGDVEELRDGVRIHGVKRNANRAMRMVFTVCRVYRKARGIGADIYHFHDPELIPAALLLKLRGNRVVYDIHEDYSSWFTFNEAIPRLLRIPVSRVFTILERFAVRRFDALVTVTPSIAARFKALNSRTVLVRNFPVVGEFDPADTDTAPWNSRENAACYIGGVTPDRGILEMIRAVCIASRTLPIKLLVGGVISPGAREIVSALSPGEAERVEFFGYVSRPRIAEMFRRSKIGLLILHPERNFLESYPTKLFEYMSAGLPVICSDFPLFHKLDKGIGCCRFVDPLDPQAIADAVLDLLTHPAEAEEMGRRGRQAVRERYSWESEARALLSLYEDILHTHTSRL